MAHSKENISKYNDTSQYIDISWGKTGRQAVVHIKLRAMFAWHESKLVCIRNQPREATDVLFFINGKKRIK